LYDIIKHVCIGYVGGQSTDVSAPAAEQLTKLKFVQVSYSSTNPILSNKDLYPYFLRIITPDNVQAKAMIDIVKGKVLLLISRMQFRISEILKRETFMHIFFILTKV
jgi:ABC-type branched-subunit amino acid transport system substrate-binding protein